MRTISAFLLLLAGCGSTGVNGGPCTPECAPGFHCVDQSCFPDLVVSDGGPPDASVATCNPACSGITPHCNDQQHCVGCTSDNQCATGSYCKITSPTQASCTPGCMTDNTCGLGKVCCGMRCSDPTSDVNNCGGCGMGCTAPHAASTCSGSKCQPGGCDPNWGDCNGDPKDGCEANLQIDVANCAACGMGCTAPHAVNACSSGCYLSSCDFGWDDCNQDAMDGCETPVLTDPQNCGGCGMPCIAPPNAMASCIAARCVVTSCNNGFADCDGQGGNGCEINTLTDNSNCGGCGMVCGNGLVCKNGSCTCQACNFPNATSSCVNNVCMMGACNAGFADCNKSTNDGCEVAIGTDPKNCGACGNVCPQNLPGCVNGACSPSTVIDPHNLKGHTEYPLDPEKCMCCNTGVTTQQTANAVCKLAGYTTAISYVSAMVVGTNCYCWDCTQKMAWADNCCGGMAARPELTSVTCQ